MYAGNSSTVTKRFRKRCCFEDISKTDDGHRAITKAYHELIMLRLLKTATSPFWPNPFDFKYLVCRVFF